MIYFTQGLTLDLYNQVYVCAQRDPCTLLSVLLPVLGFQGHSFMFVCVCVGKKGTVLKDDRRVEQKSNHLIATFFISIFCFMAAEGRRATLPVIHGR